LNGVTGQFAFAGKQHILYTLSGAAGSMLIVFLREEVGAAGVAFCAHQSDFTSRPVDQIRDTSYFVRHVFHSFIPNV
jgi:hypothetical protein